MPNDQRPLVRLPGLVLATVLAADSPVAAEGLRMIAVTCEASPGVGADWAERVCGEFLTVLAATLPKRQVVQSDSLAPGGDGLVVAVQSAGDGGVGLQLTWHPAGADPKVSRPLALAVMDRTATETMRADFYRRVLSDGPIPF